MTNTSVVDKKAETNVPVGDYFNRNSCLPAFLMDDKSLLNLSKEFLVHDQKNALKNEDTTKLNITDFKFSMPTSTTNIDSFSFTLNSSENGDFIQKIDRPEKDTENINSTLKSESAGMKYHF
jgi:hypothetical protein